jgi:hypothetical protein
MIYTNCFTICVLKKQWNKQIKNSLSNTKKCNMQKTKNKTFMNVFDTTKKYYKLACMDGVKTWPLCQVNIPSRLDEK